MCFVAVNLRGDGLRPCWKANCSVMCGGPFTGANTSRPGKLEHAAGGTLFLDEIGDMVAGGAGQDSASGGEPGGAEAGEQPRQAN